jgi:hypothetical protein
MTISSTNRKAGPFVGNDSSTSFPFAFKVFQAADIYVVRLNTSTNAETVLALGTDYTVALNANQNSNPGGTLTLPSALATGTTLTITSNVTPLQATDLTNQGGFYPSVITNALDKLTILVQQVLERLGRSLSLPLSLPSNVSTTLPLPEANKALAWNTTGTALVNYDAAQLATSLIGANTIVDRFTANGTAGPYTLSADPLTTNNTLVFIGGVEQAHNTYTIAGTSITFDTAVANGIVVEVIQQVSMTYPLTTVSPGTVNTAALQDGAVTIAKGGTGATTAAAARTALGVPTIDEVPGRLLSVVLVTAVGSPTVTIPDGANRVLGFLWGGGGAGGGAASTTSAVRRMGAGGSSGGFVEFLAEVDPTVTPTIAVTIGAAGAGSSGANGGAGGATTAGYTAGAISWSATAGGGSGGIMSSSFSETTPYLQRGPIGGSTSSSGTLNLLVAAYGDKGGDALSVAAACAYSGSGADGHGGGGAVGVTMLSSLGSSSPGGGASAFGAGGAGAIATNGGSAQAGGNGGQGRAVFFFYTL